MVNKPVTYSFDIETIEYLNTIPKNERSKTIREALKLYKFQHRAANYVKPKAEVKIIA